MPVDRKQLVRGLAISALTATLAAPQGLSAQVSEHVVSPAELQKAAADASRARQQNRETLNEFFSSEKARQALKSAHTDPEQVRNAVAVLNDAELAQLASRAKKAQADFAAGNINDRDLLIILVAIAALILIIVAVR
jgi:hypothetical protein